MVFLDSLDVAVRMNAQQRNVPFPGVKREPVLDVTALIGVVNQHVGLGIDCNP